MLKLFQFYVGLTASTHFRFVNQIFPMLFEILILFCRYVTQFWYVSVAQGLLPQVSALSILQSVEHFLSTGGASCKLNASSFTVDVWLFTWLLLHPYKS